MVYLTLTFDHRILDGAIADAFLAKVVETLQTWGRSRGRGREASLGRIGFQSATNSGPRPADQVLRDAGEISDQRGGHSSMGRGGPHVNLSVDCRSEQRAVGELQPHAGPATPPASR